MVTRLDDWIDFNPRVPLEKGKIYPFVSMDVLTPRSRYVEASESRPYKGGGAKFSTGDTLFARITPCLQNGKTSQFISDGSEVLGFGSTEFFVLRARAGKSDPAFIYYLAQTEGFRQTAINSMVGASGRQRADVQVLKDLELDLPPLEVQQQIGEILSGYDDLIAANQSRIALLEEAARNLYREWFVKLRFPGHESVKIKDGVPIGWSIQPLGAVAPLHYGKALKAEARQAGEIPVYGSSGIVGFHDRELVAAGAIVVGRKGNVGSLYYSERPSHPIDTVFFIEPNKASRRLFLAMHDLHFINSDAAVPGLNRTYAHSLPIMMPEEGLARDFEVKVTAFFTQAELLREQNTLAATARDLLLPKLMSGKIKV